MATILNLGAGKQLPLNMDPRNTFVVNVDKSYGSDTGLAQLTTEYRKWTEPETIHGELKGGDPSKFRGNMIMYIGMDAAEFIERFPFKFDMICAYRFMEHIKYSDLSYVIYLMSTALHMGGILDIIVPDYDELARMLLDEDVNNPKFEYNNIVLTTEMLNEPNDPHASIWTEQRAVKYLEHEGRFRITSRVFKFRFDERNIYMRLQAKRVEASPE